MKAPHKKKGRDIWYIWIGRREVPLGKDKVEAWRKWHQLEARALEVTTHTRVEALFTQFLDWSFKNRAPATYHKLATAIDQFQKWLDQEAPGLLVCDVKRSHLLDWADARYPLMREGKRVYANDTRRTIMTCVQRAFSWGVERGMFPYSPLSKIKKPPPISRNVCLLPGQWNTVLEHVKLGGFRDFLVALRFTGARPQEVRQIEARHLFLDHEPPFWTLESELVKGGQEARVVPLVGPMMEVCSRLANQYPVGPIFRTRVGKPWSRSSVHSACSRLMKKLKAKGINIRVTSYTMRHTFRNHATVNNAADSSIATVLGHKGTTMIRTSYNHLAQYKDHLMKVMEQATQGENF